MTIEFECVMMPDGTRRGRKMWRAVWGDNFAAFYQIGRKGQYWVTWGAPCRDGGEAAQSWAMAEFRATEILEKLVQQAPPVKAEVVS